MQLNLEVITAIIGFVGATILNKVWDYFKDKSIKEKEGIDLLLEKNTEAITKLNLTLVKLEVRIDNLSEKLVPIPKMMADVGEAHNKIRDLKNQLELINGHK